MDCCFRVVFEIMRWQLSAFDGRAVRERVAQFQRTMSRVPSLGEVVKFDDRNNTPFVVECVTTVVPESGIEVDTIVEVASLGAGQPEQ